MDTKLSTSDVRKEFPIFDKKGVFWFLGLTFGLTWLIDLAIYLRGGLSSPGWPFSLQLSMLMPAFSVILLGLFFTPRSPIFYKRPAGWGRWFQYFFLLYTLIIAIGIYGIATLAVIAFFILRDPIWRDNGDSLVQPAPVDMALSDNPGAQEKTVFQSSPSIAS